MPFDPSFWVFQSSMVTTSAAHATAVSVITSAATTNRVIVRAPLPL